MKPEKRLALNGVLKAKVEEILNQFEEKTIDKNHAITDLVKLTLEEKEDIDLEDVSNADLVAALLAESHSGWLTDTEIKDLKHIVISYERQNVFLPENLWDEQKINLVEQALKKYSLPELEDKLGITFSPFQ